MESISICYFLFFQYKEWYFLWLVIFMLDLRVSGGKCCWDCLNHFPQVRGFFDFWMMRWIWNYYWSRWVWEISCWPRVSPPKFYILIFWFWFFWGLFCTALSSNIVFWQTKTPNWVVMAWGECFMVHDWGTRLRCRTEVQDWNLRDVLPSKLPSVTSVQVSTSWYEAILCK